MSKFRSKFKGWVGEKVTQAGIAFSLDGKTYKSFHDVIIRSGKGMTQIDHVIVSPYGIFVIETKNYKGWIFGSEKNAKWTQMLGRGRKKYSFQNPLRQNYKHTKSLSAFLGLNHNVMHSIVFFIGECKLKTKMPKNVMNSGVSRYIKSFNRVILEADQIENANVKINKALDDPSLTTKAHLQSLKARRSGESEPKQQQVPREDFVKIKDTKCVNSSCGYEGNLQRSKKGKFLVYPGVLIVCLASLAALIEIFNAKFSSIIPMLFFFLIGNYGYNLAVKGSKLLICPQCRNQSSRSSKVGKTTANKPSSSPIIRPKIKTNIFVLINNEVQGPYAEEQIYSMIDSGDIIDDTQVCPEGSEQWITFKAYCDFM